MNLAKLTTLILTLFAASCAKSPSPEAQAEDTDTALKRSVSLVEELNKKIDIGSTITAGSWGNASGDDHKVVVVVHVVDDPESGLQGNPTNDN